MRAILPLLLFILWASPGAQASNPAWPDSCVRMQKTFQTLQGKYYQPILGRWKKSTWWNFPNMLRAVTDALDNESLNTDVPSDSRQEFLFESRHFARDMFVRNKWKYFGGFRNFINDDQMWWALSSIEAYEQSGDIRFLKPVWNIYVQARNTWGKTCSNGGIYWKASNHYSNAINNELFLVLASKMARLEHDLGRKADYRFYADLEYQWFFQSGMIFDSSQEADYQKYLDGSHAPNTPAPQRLLYPNLIADGLNGDANHQCKSNFGASWTYNQGVILAGLVEYSKIVDGPKAEVVLQRARALADASTQAVSLNDQGALGEALPGETFDTEMFKGIYVRDLGLLNETLPDHPYDSFFKKNSELVWKYGRDLSSSEDRPEFGFSWGHWTAPGKGEAGATSTKNASVLALFDSACRAEIRLNSAH